MREKHDTPGFGPWSIKDNTPHVQPPADLLQSMLTLRLHLDPTPKENGALRTLPGSHRHGVLSPPELSTLREELMSQEQFWPASPGDILAMKPLVLHASSKSTLPARRRVLHIEYATTRLPMPLTWAESAG